MNSVMKKSLVTMAYSLFMIMISLSNASGKTLKMAVGDAQGGTQWELGITFAKLLEEKTAEKYTVKAFANGQLGSEQETVGNVATGTLDLSILAINNITPFSPTVGILTLPYVIQSLDEAVLLTQGDVGKELTENTIKDARVRIIGWAYSGFRVLSNSKKPVSSIDDLKGLLIRVPKNEIMISAYQAWGINPTPLAWSETFTALQQKVVDGQDNPYITIHAMQFYEVQKYITNIRYIFSLEPLIISESAFQAFPAEIQQAILDAGREATLHSQKYLVEQEDNIKKDLQARGMEIIEPKDGEREWIEKATQSVWPKYYDSIGGKERLDKVLKILGR